MPFSPGDPAILAIGRNCRVVARDADVSLHSIRADDVCRSVEGGDVAAFGAGEEGAPTFDTDGAFAGGLTGG